MPWDEYRMRTGPHYIPITQLTNYCRNQLTYYPQVVSTDAMDEYADWPTRNEDFRFDPRGPSDPTWFR